jgi:hypothetical protein
VNDSEWSGYPCPLRDALMVIGPTVMLSSFIRRGALHLRKNMWPLLGRSHWRRGGCCCFFDQQES